jgi:hypothetical protein
MKKLIAIIAVAMASVMVANAQIGIVGGFQIPSTTIDTENIESNLEGVEYYHLGVAFKLPLPFGFAVQPEILYQMKGANLSETYNAAIAGEDISAKTSEFETKAGYAELGVGLQWGLDLVAFRPFIFAKPFVGYQLTGEENWDGLLAGDDMNQYLENAKNKVEYGYSIGAGLELLEHFQLSLEYFKNLGQMFNQGEFDSDKAKEAVISNYKDLESYGGIKITLGFLF